MTVDESIQGMRLQVMRRASEIGASAACREAGISRTLFYRWQHRLSRYGVDGLHPRRLKARPGPAPQLAPAIERRLLAVAIAEATWGVARLALYAQRLWRLRVAASTVQRLLRRHGLATRRQRLLVLEHRSATQAGLLTERTQQALWRLRHGRIRHVETDQPADLFCLDTFYIGKLKGVGKVWQITACDAASSYGIARILPELSAVAVARLLREILTPAVARAGWTLRRVLTDGGSEFQRRVRRGLRGAGHSPHADSSASRLDQRLRRAPAADDPHRALACGLPAPLLHQSRRARSQPPRFHAVLQL